MGGIWGGAMATAADPWAPMLGAASSLKRGVARGELMPSIDH